MANLIFNNWKKLLAGFSIGIILVYICYLKYQNNSMYKTIELYKQNDILQKQIIIQQKQQYNFLTEQNKINESSLSLYLIVNNNYKGALKDAQNEINNLKSELDSNNRITKQWMRLATGNSAAGVSSIPITPNSFDAKMESQESISASAGAYAIAEFVTDCYNLQEVHNVLIDNIYSTANNYNTNLNNMIK